jgi:1-acyl-sn-glycerol-3-phosphate acyltransferase
MISRRTLFFFILLWGSFVVVMPVGILGFLLSILGPRAWTSRMLHVFVVHWSRMLVAATGATVTVRGREKIPPSGGVCFIGNHPGDFDVLLALSLIDRPFGFTAKKEALFIPFINIWIWLLGGVFIDRKNVGKARRAIEAGARRIRSGGAMIIFPEGTRNRGQGMLPFRAGAFKLATLADAVILPLSITGSYGVWEATKTIRPVPVGIVFGDPIPTAGLSADERRLLPDRVRRVIEQGLEGQGV